MNRKKTLPKKNIQSHAGKPAAMVKKRRSTDSGAADIIIAVALLAVSLLILTCLVLGERTGAFGSFVCGFFRGILGPFCFLLPLGMLAVSFFYRDLSRKNTLVFKWIMLGVFCVLVSSLYSLFAYGTMKEVSFSIPEFYSDGIAGEGGGVIGSVFAKLFTLLFGQIMAAVLSSLAVVVIFCFLPGLGKSGLYKLIFDKLSGKRAAAEEANSTVKNTPVQEEPKVRQTQVQEQYRPMKVDTSLALRVPESQNDMPETVSQKRKKDLRPSDVGFFDFAEPGVFVTKDFDADEDDEESPAESPLSAFDDSERDPFGVDFSVGRKVTNDIYYEPPVNPPVKTAPQEVRSQKPAPSYGKKRNEETEMPRAYSPFANPFISFEDFKKGSAGKKTEKTVSKNQTKSSEPPRAYSPFADPFASMNYHERREGKEIPQSYIACDVARREPESKSAPGKAAEDDEDDAFIRHVSGSSVPPDTVTNKTQAEAEMYAVPDKNPVQCPQGFVPVKESAADFLSGNTGAGNGFFQYTGSGETDSRQVSRPTVQAGGADTQRSVPFSGGVATGANSYESAEVSAPPSQSTAENVLKNAVKMKTESKITQPQSAGTPFSSAADAGNYNQQKTAAAVEDVADEDEEETDDDYDESGQVYYGHRRLRYPDYVYPRSDLLERQPMANITTEEEIAEVQRKLMDKISSFHVDATLAGYSIGPTITRHDIVPGPGVKIKALTALTDDISLAMQSEGVRIAPVPGKAVVGVEVPNKKVTTVSLRSLVENREFIEAKNKTTVCVGLTVTGKPVFMDIDEMPHVLIAGQTKSGKSVAINCMLLSLLFRATPDEVQLILIDPKRVELNIYSNLPHLIMPVIDDPQRAAAALSWAVAEMERRYELFDKVMARNTDEYYAMKDENPDFEYMPRIIIVIDELADLMLQVREHVEEKINRLAAKARACGMYLLIGTQRPSVDIITGLIKANIPARISFKVSSPQDSRIILGNTGAEKLLGKGDMLYHPTGGTQQRLQGAFVSGSEIKRVTKFIIDYNGNAQFDPEVMYSLESEVDKMNKAGKKAATDDEVAIDCADVDFEYLCKAAELVINMGKATTNIIQRHLKIGFNRASNITEKLEDLGFISKSNGSKPRDVLIDMQGYLEWKNNQSK